MYRYVYVIIDVVYTYMIMHVWTSRMEKQKKQASKQSKAKQGKVRQSKASKQANKQTSTQ